MQNEPSDPFANAGDGTLEWFREQKESRESGKTSIVTPWAEVNRLIGGGLRLGEVSCLAGPGGNGKTNWALDLIVRLAGQNRPGLYMPLEDTHSQIMNRIHAIVHEDWGLIEDIRDDEDEERRKNLILWGENAPLCARIDQDYIMRNPKEAKVVDGILRAPKLVPQKILDWINTEMCSKQDLLIIDPISMINFGSDGQAFYEAQEEFVQCLHAFAAYHKIHIMLLAHVRKRTFRGGQVAPLTIDDIQGSAAFNRHTRYVFLLDYSKKGKDGTLFGGQPVHFKHTLDIAKCNFGSGTGTEIAMGYTTGPWFKELGVLEDE